MSIAALLLLVPCFSSPPADHGLVAPRPARLTSAEVCLPVGISGDDYPDEVAEESVEEALACGASRPLEGVRPASCRLDPFGSLVPHAADGRQRPQRAPPAL
jgi:hypothetical protein